MAPVWVVLSMIPKQKTSLDQKGTTLESLGTGEASAMFLLELVPATVVYGVRTLHR